MRACSIRVAAFLQLVYPHLGGPELASWHRLLIAMSITTAAWVGVTLLAFAERIHRRFQRT